MADRAEYWRRMMTAWESSGLTQAEFCRRRGLKAVTFGWWKRQLVGVSRRSGRSDERGHGSHSGLGCRGPRRHRANARASVRSSARSRTPSFVEVTVAGNGPRSTQASGRESVSARGDEVTLPAYEVTLPCGLSIRLPRDFDPDKAAALIQAARSC